jgi:hypothetical protein
MGFDGDMSPRRASVIDATSKSGRGGFAGLAATACPSAAFASRSTPTLAPAPQRKTMASAFRFTQNPRRGASASGDLNVTVDDWPGIRVGRGEKSGNDVDVAMKTRVLAYSEVMRR